LHSQAYRVRYKSKIEHQLIALALNLKKGKPMSSKASTDNIKHVSDYMNGVIKKVKIGHSSEHTFRKDLKGALPKRR